LEGQGERGEEEEPGTDGGNATEEGDCSAATKRARRRASTQSCPHAGILPRLEKDDENHEDTQEDVDSSQEGQHRGAHPTESPLRLTTPSPTWGPNRPGSGRLTDGGEARSVQAGPAH
jgi:hypothetical protein